MKVKDLAYECKELDCDECQYEDFCLKLSEKLKHINPYELLTILEEEISEQENCGMGRIKDIFKNKDITDKLIARATTKEPG